MEFITANDALVGLAETVMTGGANIAGTKEIPHVSFTVTQPWDRYFAPGRNENVVAQIAETLWVLRGENDARWLQRYLPRALDFSDDGKVWRAGYGPRIKGQIRRVHQILSENPDSRQAVIGIWDAALDGDPNLDTRDRPCNLALHFMIRDGELLTNVFTRSNDLIWGWSGANQFVWSVLAELLANALGVTPGQITYNVSSLHIYERHWSRAESLYEFPAVMRATSAPTYKYSIDDLERDLELLWGLEGDLRRATFRSIPGLVSPTLVYFARVLVDHWGYQSPARRGYLAGLPAALADAARRHAPRASSGLLREIDTLHREKSAAYGDSWKRRGEFSILANIARKVDRLDMGGETSDESQRDTAIDLLVYSAKYLNWLEAGPEDDADAVRNIARWALEHDRVPKMDLGAAMDEYIDEHESYRKVRKVGFARFMLLLQAAARLR